MPAVAMAAVVREPGGELVEDLRAFICYARASVREGGKCLAVDEVT